MKYSSDRKTIGSTDYFAQDVRKAHKSILGAAIVLVAVNFVFWGGLIAVGVWAISKWIIPLF